MANYGIGFKAQVAKNIAYRGCYSEPGTLIKIVNGAYQCACPGRSRWYVRTGIVSSVINRLMSMQVTIGGLDQTGSNYGDYGGAA